MWDHIVAKFTSTKLFCHAPAPAGEPSGCARSARAARGEVRKAAATSRQPARGAGGQRGDQSRGGSASSAGDQAPPLRARRRRRIRIRIRTTTTVAYEYERRRPVAVVLRARAEGAAAAETRAAGRGTTITTTAVGGHLGHAEEDVVVEPAVGARREGVDLARVRVVPAHENARANPCVSHGAFARTVDAIPRISVPSIGRERVGHHHHHQRRTWGCSRAP